MEEGTPQTLQSQNWLSGNLTSTSHVPSSTSRSLEPPTVLHFPLNATGYYRGQWEASSLKGEDERGERFVKFQDGGGKGEYYINVRM